MKEIVELILVIICPILWLLSIGVMIATSFFLKIRGFDISNKNLLQRLFFINDAVKNKIFDLQTQKRLIRLKNSALILFLSPFLIVFIVFLLEIFSDGFKLK